MSPLRPNPVKGSIADRDRFVEWLWKKILMIAAFAAPLIGMQIAVFHCFFYPQRVLTAADAVIVFDGAENRIIEGVRVVSKGMAPVLVISPASETQVKDHQRILGLVDTLRIIPEPNARTTYENAYYSADIIRQQGFDSIILVTSDYHMPRALILLRLMTIGRNLSIQRSPAPFLYTDKWQREKKLYNEMVQLWGSLWEMACHQISGKPVSHRTRNSMFFTFLEKILLVE